MHREVTPLAAFFMAIQRQLTAGATEAARVMQQVSGFPV